jgi:hypothetical protein
MSGGRSVRRLVPWAAEVAGLVAHARAVLRPADWMPKGASADAPLSDAAR